MYITVTTVDDESTTNMKHRNAVTTIDHDTNDDEAVNTFTIADDDTYDTDDEEATCLIHVLTHILRTHISRMRRCAAVSVRLTRTGCDGRGLDKMLEVRNCANCSMCVPGQPAVPALMAVTCIIITITTYAIVSESCV